MQVDLGEAMAIGWPRPSAMVGFAGAKERSTRPVNWVHLKALWKVGEAQHEGGAPATTGDAGSVNVGCLSLGPTRRLHYAAFDLITDAAAIGRTGAILRVAFAGYGRLKDGERDMGPVGSRVVRCRTDDCRA